jgi:hypothetical protein
MTGSWPKGLGLYVVRHPAEGLVLARAGWPLRRRGWWRRFPPLPLPAPSYWAFRLSTVSGSSGESPSVAAMLEAARWSLRQSVGR